MKKEVLLSLVVAIVEDYLKEVPVVSGPRGPRGANGKDFDFNEHQESISNFVKQHVENNLESLKLKFSDLSEEEILSLKGNSGKDGKDGKDFLFEEHSESISNLITNYILSNVDKFTPEIDTESLRGRDGIDGKDGKDFIFEEHEEKINETLVSYVANNKDKFTLKYSELSDEEKQLVRGPRGQRGRTGENGRDGKDFSFEESREKIKETLIENKREFILKFSDLTEKEKEELKLKFEHLTDEEKLTLRGSRGQRGKQGIQGENGKSAYEIWLEKGNTGTESDFFKSLIGPRGIQGLQGLTGVSGKDGKDGKNGKDGKDGKDAAEIVNIKVKEINGKISFEFLFDDGTYIETNSVELPKGSSSWLMVGGQSGGQTTPVTGGEVSVEKDGVLLGVSEILDFIGDNINVTYDSLNKKATIEVVPNCVSILDEGVEITDCAKSINFTGDLVEVVNTTTMADWVLLSDVTTLSGYTVSDPSQVTVNISSPEPANVVIPNVPCDVSVFVGAVVRTTPLGTIVNALADSLTNSNILGIVETKPTSTTCNVRVLGVTPEIFSGLDVTKEYYLSDTVPGQISTTIPTVSGRVKIMVGQPFSSGKMLVLRGERVVRA